MSYLNHVKEFYDNDPVAEWERLNIYKLEYDITMRLIEDSINENSKILDVGGGPGRYAFGLTEKKHNVTLFDLSSENINLAKVKSLENDIHLEDYVQGTATDLSRFESNSFDVVLCLGPLYHLVEKSDRIKAIQESLRVLKKGGLLFVSFISAYGPIVDAIRNNPDKILYRYDYYIEKLSKGERIMGEGIENFTNAFYFHPQKIDSFMEQFAIRKKRLCAIEGVIAQSSRKLSDLSKQEYDLWVDLIYQTIDDPFTWGATDHMMFIGEKS